MKCCVPKIAIGIAISKAAALGLQPASVSMKGGLTWGARLRSVTSLPDGGPLLQPQHVRVVRSGKRRHTGKVKVFLEGRAGAGIHPFANLRVAIAKIETGRSVVIAAGIIGDLVLIQVSGAEAVHVIEVCSVVDAVLP